MLVGLYELRYIGEAAVLQLWDVASSQGPPCIQQEGRWDGSLTDTLCQPGTNTDCVVRASQQAGRLRKVWWQQMVVGRSPQEGRHGWPLWKVFSQVPCSWV